MIKSIYLSVVIPEGFTTKYVTLYSSKYPDSESPADQQGFGGISRLLDDLQSGLFVE